MINQADNKMFPPSYQKLWPAATKAFALEEAAAKAYAADPTPARLMLLEVARKRYQAACLSDERNQLQAKFRREDVTEGERPAFAIPVKRHGVKCG